MPYTPPGHCGSASCVSCSAFYGPIVPDDEPSRNSLWNSDVIDDAVSPDIEPTQEAPPNTCFECGVADNGGDVYVAPRHQDALLGSDYFGAMMCDACASAAIQQRRQEFGACDRCGERRRTARYRDDSEADRCGFYGEVLCDYCESSAISDYETPDEYEDEDEDYDNGRDDPASQEIEVYEPEPEPESSGEDDNQPPPRLLIPTITNLRQARMITFEQEIAHGGNAVCGALYDQGYTAGRGVRGYHSGDRDDEFCRVERDSSVDAEIIWPRLKLHQQRVARKFEAGLRVVKDLIAEDQVKLDMNCGGHIHVDASGLPAHSLTSMYNIWNHVEDVVFRLASANWNAHRTQVAYSNYAPMTAKGFRTQREIHQEMGYGRGALNLSNFIAARSNCRCGATNAGAWEECSCTLRKNTIEFRVWNTTANLRKIHAYSALSVALVEFARQNVVTVDDLEPFGWTAQKSADASHIMPGLTFIRENLAFTPTEREDIEYCVERCSLAEVL